MKKIAIILAILSIVCPVFVSAAPFIVDQGGTGTSTFPAGQLLVGNGKSPVTATSSPSVSSITVTNGTATSTFAGNVKVSGNLQVDGNFFAPVSLVSSGNATINGNLTVTGVSKLADGTVGTPSLSFTNDTNTGIYSGGADILRFVTGGSDRITINSSGNVGIGTTSPYAKLSLQSTSGGSTPLLVVASSTNGTGTSTALFVSANGNVGVGTTSPVSTLDVVGTGKFGNLGSANPNKASGAALRVFGNDPGTQSNYNPGSLATGLYFETSGSSNNYSGLQVANGAGATFTVTNAGNVGIGTTNPTAALTFPAASTGIVLHNQADQTTNTETGFARWSGNSFQIGTDKAGTGTARGLEFFTGGVSRFTLTGAGDYSPTADNTLFLGLSSKRFYTGYFSNSLNIGTGASPQVYFAASGNSWLNGGNVGIGTTNPSQKLEVNGGVRYNTATAKPTCDSTVRGTTWFTQGAPGVKDTFEVCAKDAADAYAWRTLY